MPPSSCRRRCAQPARRGGSARTAAAHPAPAAALLGAGPASARPSASRLPGCGSRWCRRWPQPGRRSSSRMWGGRREAAPAAVPAQQARQARWEAAHPLPRLLPGSLRLQQLVRLQQLGSQQGSLWRGLAAPLHSGEAAAPRRHAALTPLAAAPPVLPPASAPPPPPPAGVGAWCPDCHHGSYPAAPAAARRAAPVPATRPSAAARAAASACPAAAVHLQWTACGHTPAQQQRKQLYTCLYAGWLRRTVQPLHAWGTPAPHPAGAATRLPAAAAAAAAPGAARHRQPAPQHACMLEDGKFCG